MTKESPLKDLVIRTAVARRTDLGFIYAADLKKEQDEIPHAFIFKWKAGAFSRGECDYDAHSACVIEHPQAGLVDVSGAGYYSINTQQGISSGDIINNSHPPTSEPRLGGGIRSVAAIAGVAHAIGLRGMVYRLDNLSSWTRIDNGLPETFNGQAIHGFAGNDVYAVGRHGECWHFDGQKWTPVELPTSANLTSVKCAPNGVVYVAGYKGVLISGRGSAWSVIDQRVTKGDIWDLEWFEDNLYISTMAKLYRLKGNSFEAVDFNADPPKTCYQLSTAPGVLWSNGEYDLMSFDGKTWTRIV